MRKPYKRFFIQRSRNKSDSTSRYDYFLYDAITYGEPIKFYDMSTRAMILFNNGKYYRVSFSRNGNGKPPKRKRIRHIVGTYDTLRDVEHDFIIDDHYKKVSVHINKIKVTKRDEINDTN